MDRAAFVASIPASTPTADLPDIFPLTWDKAYEYQTPHSTNSWSKGSRMVADVAKQECDCVF